jgi:hypothetical protein
LSTWNLEVGALEVTDCFWEHDVLQNNLRQGAVVWFVTDADVNTDKEVRLTAQVMDHVATTSKLRSSNKVRQREEKEIKLPTFLHAYIGLKSNFTVNQLLFVATLFPDTSVKNWLGVNDIRDQAFFINTGLCAIIPCS